jgi:hypothetical protein
MACSAGCNFVLANTPPAWHGPDGAESSKLRGRNLDVSFTEVCESVRLDVDDRPDEYVVALLGQRVIVVVSRSLGSASRSSSLTPVSPPLARDR